ncbi:hypothetical protein V1264_003603 [Littorina saxatilis]|uniref:IGFBP N-terminal domain-containing protein n=1 Tax=Littorina saxatilis TaxID=31220 RepID=A0AAN9G921_9CAEN
MSLPKGFSIFAVTVLVLNVFAPVYVESVRSFDRELLRKYFKCPACDPFTCPRPVGYPACQLVLEPGVCACCKVCARQAGQFCGLGSGRCGHGLSCRPMPGDEDPLGAILNGRAVCM